MKMKMAQEVDLGREPIGHLLLVLAVPAITSQIVKRRNGFWETVLCPWWRLPLS